MLTKWLTFPMYLRPEEGAGGDGGEGTPPPAGGEGGSEGTPPEPSTVPLKALQKEREKNAALQAEIDKHAAAAKEAERAKLDEVERVKLEAKEANDKVTALTDQITTANRKALVRQAATQANFVDPDDAIALIALSEIEDEAAAAAAVKDLAKKKKHLVAAPAGGSGGPRKVLENGKTVTGDESSTDTYSEEELKGFSKTQYAELYSDPKTAAKLSRSLKALTAAA